MDDPPPLDPALSRAADAARGRRRLSEVLRALAEDGSSERVTLGDMLAAMQDRAFGALLLVLALPNALPMPPGTSAVLGVPLMVVTLQLALGHRAPTLPGWLAGRSLARHDLRRALARALPRLERAERLLRPRLPLLTSRPAERAIGGLCLVLSLVLFLPLPLGNILPALAVLPLAAGILERDGVAVIVGAVLAVLSVAFVGVVTFAVVKTLIAVLAQALTG